MREKLVFVFGAILVLAGETSERHVGVDECWMNGMGNKFPLELTSNTVITLIKLWSILRAGLHYGGEVHRS